MKNLFNLALTFSFVSSISLAQVPQTISYQGFYTDENGVPINDAAADSHTVNFLFFAGESLTSSFSRSIENVKITKGLFSVVIGRNAEEDGDNNLPLPFEIGASQFKVQVGIDGPPSGEKIPLTAVPYALWAGRVNAANITGSQSLPASVLPATVPIGNGLADRLTLWSGAGTVTHDNDLSWNSTSNTLSAVNLSGNGSALTSLSAANLTGSNSLPAAVLPTNVPLGNGAANSVAFWTGTSTVGHDSDLTWDSNTNTLSTTNFIGNFSGSGASLSVPAANLTGTGTLPTTVLPSNVPTGNGVAGGVAIWTGTGTVGTDAGLIWNNVSGTLSATNFLGNGSGLSALAAANLTGANTLPASVLPTTVPLGNGQANSLTLWSGAGTVSHDADLSWNSTTNTLAALNFSGNGSLLTSISAANIIGTNALPESVLPATVPLGNGAANKLSIWNGTGTVAHDDDLSWNDATNTLTATNLAGNGSAITSLSAGNLTGANTLPSGVLPTSVPLGNGSANRLTIWSGVGSVTSDANLSWDNTTSTLSAAKFSGNGSALTDLSAANLTGANSLPAAVLPTTVPLGNGATNQLTYWTNTSAVGSDADLSWNSSTNTLSAANFSGSGSGLTSLPAANITGANALPVGVLPANVPVGNGANGRIPIWTGTGTIASNANLVWDNTNSRLGVGSASPETSLHLRHDNGVATQGFSIENLNTGNPWSFYVSSSDELWLVFGGGEKGEFNPASGSYTAVSDKRLKKDIKPLRNVLPDVLDMTALSYLFNPQPDTAQRSVGFLAQDVKTVFPEIVKYSSENDLHTMDYSALGVLAIKAIQEQQAIIDELRREIDELKATLNDMKTN